MSAYHIIINLTADRAFSVCLIANFKILTEEILSLLKKIISYILKSSIVLRLFRQLKR
jgi:hypothetical protein